MENSQSAMQVAKFDPAVTYAGASQLKLSESEMKALSDPFDDLDYEIRPDGFIYLPQVLGTQRLNKVVGVGQWTILLINTGSQQMTANLNKVFYDGALVIRGCFVSRAAGEASYSVDNNNQSYASALEAAKSDCRQRCCKDLGIAADAWNPAFVRAWQKKNAVRVYVKDDKSRTGNKVVWRRKDVDPFWNETGLVPDGTFTVPQSQQNNQPKEQAQQSSNDFPWLNHGPEFEAVMKALLDGTTTINTIRKTKYRISKETEEAMLTRLKDRWIESCDDKKTLPELTALYNENKGLVDTQPWLKIIFQNRQAVLKKSKQTA